MSRSALFGATRCLLGLLTLVLVLIVSRTARAQRAEITANVDNDVVELGETLTYTQQALVHGGDSPSDPKPGPLPGFTLQGVSSGPIHMRTIINGAVDDVNGLTTSWSLRATKLGSFTLGPSQVTVGGTRRTSGAVRVQVVERGKGSPRMRRSPSIDPFGGSPLDPFKGLFDFGDDDRARNAPAAPSADPKFAMNEPRAPIAFLHATIDKSRAVVGEQVTLNVYLYEDPYSRQGRPSDVHEPTANDFVKRSLLEDETRVIGVGTALVGGSPWNVKLIRRSALFPLKSGRLTIEPMSMTLPQARVGLRSSESLHVDVVDPPLAGRPPGYAVGDVGDMSLQATVTPRAAPNGGAVGVTIELRGTGNLPFGLTLPTTPGVEWLEPQVREKLGPQQNDRFGGTRTFSYVVRVHDHQGEVDLGEVRLPYFDADKGSYLVARATLGVVNVAAGNARDAGASEAEVILPGLPKERRVLENPRAETYLSERPFYWVTLFGSPLACAFGLGAQGFLRRYRERRAEAAPSLDRIAKQRRSDAASACAGDDGNSAMGAIARFVEADVLLRTGVNLRGVAGDGVMAELGDAGIDKEAAAQILEILRRCEDARFSGAGIKIEDARATWSRACDLLGSLARNSA